MTNRFFKVHFQPCYMFLGEGCNNHLVTKSPDSVKAQARICSYFLLYETLFVHTKKQDRWGIRCILHSKNILPLLPLIPSFQQIKIKRLGSKQKSCERCEDWETREWHLQSEARNKNLFNALLKKLMLEYDVSRIVRMRAFTISSLNAIHLEAINIDSEIEK